MIDVEAVDLSPLRSSFLVLLGDALDELASHIFEGISALKRYAVIRSVVVLTFLVSCIPKLLKIIISIESVEDIRCPDGQQDCVVDESYDYDSDDNENRNRVELGKELELEHIKRYIQSEDRILEAKLRRICEHQE